jgi:hypothetical protein
MLSKNTYSSFAERPEEEAKQFFFRLTFFILKILEGLFHGLAKSLPKPSWIEAEEYFVESLNCVSLVRHNLVIIYQQPLT